MKNLSKCLIVFICAISLAGCGKSSSNTPAPLPPASGKSSAKDLLSFSFLKSNNAINADIAASISGTNVSASLVPNTILNALKATFTASDKATVTVGSTAQVSGTTANDFSNPVNYTVTAEDGSTQKYIVTVSGSVVTITRLMTR